MTVAPAVSVIMPTFDRAALAREAIESVKAQSFTGWELIIVDDGSGAAMREYLETLADERIRVLWHEHTGNPAVVRNAGAAAARGKWLAFLDSDDLWRPAKLELQLARLERDDVQWSCTGVEFIDAAGHEIPQRAGPRYVARSGWILEDLINMEATATLPTLMIRRDLFDLVGGFDPGLVMRHDLDLVLRLSAVHPIAALDEPLTLVRDHDDRSTRARPLTMQHEHNVRVMRRVLASDVSCIARERARARCIRELRALARAQRRDAAYFGAALSLLEAAGVALSALSSRRSGR